MRALERAALLIVVCVQAACATTKLGGLASPTLEQATLSVGDRQYQLETCRSGDLAYFLGVDLADASRGARVRLAIEPMAGPHIRVDLEQGGARSGLILSRAQCRQLEAEVTQTGWVVNTVRDVSGFVDADCTTEAGQAVTLHVRFTHCH